MASADCRANRALKLAAWVASSPSMVAILATSNHTDERVPASTQTRMVDNIAHLGLVGDTEEEEEVSALVGA